MVRYYDVGKGLRESFYKTLLDSDWNLETMGTSFDVLSVSPGGDTIFTRVNDSAVIISKSPSRNYSAMISASSMRKMKFSRSFLERLTGYGLKELKKPSGNGEGKEVINE